MPTIEQINETYAASGGREFQASGRFAIASRTTRESKAGKTFAVIELRDPTGAVTARCFDEGRLAALGSLNAIDATLRVQEFNGSLSAVLQQFEEADLTPAEVMEYAGLDGAAHAARIAVLDGWREQCRGTVWGDVVEAAFAEPGTWEQFLLAPAAVKKHHAEPGGLVRHLVEVGKAGLGLLDSIDGDYDRAYFLAGVFLHDIGKLDTYSAPPTIEWTALGQLAEHQIWSTFRVGKACARVDVSAHDEALLIHMIEQAHGAYRHAEWQDPVGVEVKALATADFFSSRLGQTQRERQAVDLLDGIDEAGEQGGGAGSAAAVTSSGGLF